MFCNRLLALKLKQLFGGSCQPFGLMKGGGGGKKGKGKGVKIGETKYTYIADGEIRVCDRLTNQPCRLPWPLRLTSLRWCRTDVCQRMGMKP